MAKRFTNRIRWKGQLFSISQAVDENDRPVTAYELERAIYYEELGITAQEKYLSKQGKTEVVRRIKVRWDNAITEKGSAIEIKGVKYNITRIFTNLDAREMELSLAYVD
ncbi:phage head closure protein [Enterococcus dispar]|uniref:phage head closure protein n=1 Tax=Enterococcus dispar TaxID=44009 RepID=UPI0021D425BC|nr:phage head closure protein [Enterococcus dispar]MCU7356811.1 phage head closure protein [Enterococcus dispar]MDT2704912.1 phage head closure protein [Enterococcus dispar]